MTASNHGDALRIYNNAKARMEAAFNDNFEDATMYKWISTSEMLPENGIQVIVYGTLSFSGQPGEDDFVGTDHCIDRRVKNGAWSEFEHVKYWMPFTAIPVPYDVSDEE